MSVFRAPGFVEIENFYEGLCRSFPATALTMHTDITHVARCAITENWEDAYEAVSKLRYMALGLPISQRMILDFALRELGYTQTILEDR